MDDKLKKLAEEMIQTPNMIFCYPTYGDHKQTIHWKARFRKDSPIDDFVSSLPKVVNDLSIFEDSETKVMQVEWTVKA